MSGPEDLIRNPIATAAEQLVSALEDADRETVIDAHSLVLRITTDPATERCRKVNWQRLERMIRAALLDF